MYAQLIDPPARGTVEKTISPSIPGRVRAFGTYFRAEVYGTGWRQALEPGQEVLVVGRRGAILLVMPLKQFAVLTYIQ